MLIILVFMDTRQHAVYKTAPAVDTITAQLFIAPKDEKMLPVDAVHFTPHFHLICLCKHACIMYRLKAENNYVAAIM